MGRQPLFRRRQVQVAEYAAAWSAADDEASGCVGVVLTRLRAADGRPWRVVNLQWADALSEALGLQQGGDL